MGGTYLQASELPGLIAVAAEEVLCRANPMEQSLLQWGSSAGKVHFLSVSLFKVVVQWSETVHHRYWLWDFLEGLSKVSCGVFPGQGHPQELQSDLQMVASCAGLDDAEERQS